MANTTLKFGNGEWYGKEDTILAYNDLNSNYKPLAFDFERGSTATRINKEGLIETVGANEPRVDYKDDSKGALLLEPSRSNLFDYSNDFNNWSNNNCVINSNSAISLDGTLNATKLIANTTNETHYVRKTVSSITSNFVTFSLFAKKAEYKYLALSIGSGASTRCYYDLENGLTYDIGSGVYSAEIIKNIDGWFKLVITYENPSSSEIFRIYNVNNDNNLGFIGDDASGIYIFGVQAEEGSYPTSLINTQGTVQTRLADTCSQTVPDGVIGQTEGTIYWEGIIDEVATTNHTFFGLETATQNLIRFRTTGDDIAAQVFNGSVNLFFQSTPYVLGSYLKVALAYKSGSYAFYKNGILIGSGTDTSTVPTCGSVITNSLFGNVGNIKCRINQAQLYNTRLSNSELASLTQV